MIEITNVSVFNLENALRGARNPMNSWGRMDSAYDEAGNYVLGPNDLLLLNRLAVAGSDHRKFMRQIFVSVDFNGPMYWWKEFDTYKVGTVANSTSTMHKLHAKPIELGDFSHDKLSGQSLTQLEAFIAYLEGVRLQYMETKDKQHWWDLIQLLPASYNQLRTVSLNYETLRNIYFARKNHKLDEWHVVCDWIRTLPYAEELILAQQVMKQQDPAGGKV